METLIAKAHGKNLLLRADDKRKAHVMSGIVFPTFQAIIMGQVTRFVRKALADPNGLCEHTRIIRRAISTRHLARYHAT